MSIIQTSRTNQTITAGIHTINLNWGTAFPDNTYYVLFPNPQFQLTSSSQPLPATIQSWSYLAAGAGIALVVFNPNSSAMNTQVDVVGVLASAVDNESNVLIRLAALDGVGTSDPTTAAVPTLNSSFNSLNYTNMQAILALESTVSNISDSLYNLATSVKIALQSANVNFLTDGASNPIQIKLNLKSGLNIICTPNNLGDVTISNVLSQYTVSTLPIGVEGATLYATNGRKIGEGSGFGTGVMVYFSNGSWRVMSTDQTVQS